MNTIDPWAQLNQLNTSPAPANDPWAQLDQLNIAPVAPVATGADVTWRDDLKAGWLAAQQGATALTQVAPGIINRNSQGQLENTAADTEALLAANPEAAAQLAAIDTDIQALTARLGQRGTDVNAIQQRIAALADQRAQINAVLGTQTNPGAIREQGQANFEQGTEQLMSGAQRIGELGQDMPAADPRAMEALTADTWRGAIGSFLENPGVTTRTALLRSLPAMVPSVAGTVGGMAAAGPAGAFVGGGATGAATEFAMSLSEGIQTILQDAKIDPQDEAAVSAFFDANPALLDQAMQDAGKRAGIIGAVDALSGGLAGKAVDMAQGAGRAARVGAVGLGAGIEAAGEGAGEAAAQLATTGEIQPGEVLAESIAGGVMGFPQTAGMTAVEALRPDANVRPGPSTPNAQEEERPVADVAADVGPVLVDEAGQPLPQGAWPTGTEQVQPGTEQVQPPRPVVQPAEPVRTAPVQPGTDVDVDGEATATSPDVKQAPGPGPQALGVTGATQPTAPDVEPGVRTSVPVDTADPDLNPDAEPTAPDTLTTLTTLTTPDQAVARPDEPGANEGMVKNPAVEPAKEARVALDEMDAKLDEDVERAVTRFVGVPAGARDGARTTGGVMVPDDVEVAARDPKSPLAVKMETAFAPVREKLRSIYGDTVRLYRSQAPVKTEPGVAYGSRGPDGTRTVLSWTLDPAVAEAFAGVEGKDPVAFTPEQIEAAATAYAETGRADLPGTKYSFRREEDLPGVFGAALYQGEDHVTGFYDDPAEIRRFMERRNDDTAETLADRKAKREQIIEADIPLDEVMFATDRAGQMEFLVRNGADKAVHIDDKGVRQEKAAAPAEPENVETTDAEPDAPTGGALPDMADAADTGPADADPTRSPRGGFTPNMRNVSFTERGSIYEQAFRDAGVDPDKARLMPVAQQINLLVRLFADKFGITVDRAGGGLHLKGNEAVSQLLDGYRNITFMAHVMQLPARAMSLNNTLTLRLEKFLGRYLGVYEPATRTIGLPGRSNSFAHEWMHALDHFLALNLKNEDALLSQLTRNNGIDPMQSLDAAFIDLIHTMFFNETDLALRMMRLEVEASATIKNGPEAGQPTKAALKAMEQLDRLRSGATRMRIAPSAYRQRSADYAPAAAGYYASVHEMIARAFEAYIAHRVELAGGTTEFIAKGDEAYLSNADARLAMTFPKATDRVRIFAAIDAVLDHVRQQQALGPGQAAARPDDTDIADPSYWAKMALAEGDPGLIEAFTEEMRTLANRARSFFKSPLGALKSSASGLAMNAGIAKGKTEKTGDYLRRIAVGFGDVSKSFVYSTRGITKRLIDRQAEAARPFLQFVTDRIMTDPGTGREGQEITFEEYREREVNRASTTITNMFKSLGLNKLGRANFTLSDADSTTVWNLMLGQNAPARPELVRLAAGLRRIMNDAYEKATKAGVQMGFIEDTGYMPRVLVANRVHEDTAGFTADAEKLYGVVFDNITQDIDPRDAVRMAQSVSLSVSPLVNPGQGPFAGLIKAVRKANKAAKKAAAAAQSNPSPATSDAAVRAEQDLDAAMDDLLSAIRDPYRRNAAQEWATRVTVGGSLTFDSLGPDASFAKLRTLPKEADTIMQKWYDADPITSVLNYVHGTASRSAYQERFGKTGGNERLDDILTRDAVRDAVRANPGKYNPNTPKGRLNILNDLADHKTDNLLQMAFFEAQAAGADGRDIATIRGMVEEVTGRGGKGAFSFVDKLSSWLYVLGYITMLPRASWTAIMEPVTIVMRTGDVKAGFRTFGFYVREAARGMRSTQELARLAEMIGVVSTPLHDTVMLNRLSGDFGNTVEGNTLMARFFRANMLAQLTNAQRRAVLASGYYWMRDMASVIVDPNTDSTKRRILEAEFADLGIGKDQVRPMAEWLAGGKGLLTLDELNTPQGSVAANAVARLVDQTIQNPRRADKPIAASTALGRVAYSLMSFLYTFYRNVHLATANRAKRNYQIAREEGSGVAGATAEAALSTAASFGVGFLMMFAGQLVVSAVREWVFNHDRWEEKEDEDELAEWLVPLAISRTGIAGPVDPVLNALTGMRYERDLSNLFIGAYPSFVLSSVQNMLKGMPKAELYEGGPGVGARNSENTNTAERTAAKSFYRLVVSPAANIGLSALNVAGPLGQGLRYGALLYSSSASMSDHFADWTVGEPDN